MPKYEEPNTFPAPGLTGSAGGVYGSRYGHSADHHQAEKQPGRFGAFVLRCPGDEAEVLGAVRPRRGRVAKFRGPARFSARFARKVRGKAVHHAASRPRSEGVTKARMQMANTTTITGNLTREPEIRYTREGQATAQLGVAVNRRWQDRTTQEWQESTSFFDVICWRDLAENVALSLTKGMRVVVTGRLEHRTWETEEGEHRSKVEITADEVGASLRFATADVHKVERRGVGARPRTPTPTAEAWRSRPEWCRG